MALDSTVADLQQLYTKAKNARQRFDPIWFTNLAYYQGNQWLWWSRGRLVEPRLDPWRVTFTDNRLIGIVRTEVAKMTKQRPVFVATPTTGDEDDLAAAELAERMLSYVWREHNMSARQRSVLMWSRVCGAGFWKVYWDSTIGDPVQVLVGPDGQPVAGPDGRPLDPQTAAQTLPPEILRQLQVKTVAQGDLCVEVKSPFAMYVDPLGDDVGLSSAEWLIEESVRSRDYVRQRFDVDLDEDADAIPGLAESRMGSMPGGETSSSTAYKGVRLREYWSRSSSSEPGGKYTVWAKDRIIYEKANPYGDIPYVMFSGIPVPGRFWPTCIVEQLRQPQAELNKTRSQIRENASRIGNPALLKNRLSNLDYSGLPGEIVEYDDLTPNAVPSYLQPPEMPGYVEKEIDWLQQSFQEISGQHEVTSGQVPPGVTAASAISLLQEQDDTRLGPDIADMERAIGMAGTMILKLIGTYYTDERTIRIAGEDGEWDIFPFRGSMLKDTARIDVQAGSAIPLSKAGKQAAMSNMLTLFVQNGVALTQRQIGQFMADMEVGGFERLIDQFNSDEKQVNSENRLLATGTELPLNPFDDDQAHIELHQEFQKTSKFRRLPEPVQAVFEKHVELHQARAQQAADANRAQQIEDQQRVQENPMDLQVETVRQQGHIQAAEIAAQARLMTAEQKATSQTSQQGKRPSYRQSAPIYNEPNS